MNVLEELKEVIDVKVTIDEEAMSDKIFDNAVDPLMQKLMDIIPTEFDNVLYASKKEFLKEEFRKLLSKGVDIVEAKTGMDLDGKDEAVL